ncbi:MAG: CinA family protein [Lachnospiraceae bacterium]|nr:CinA family protein [Lachnospiraceae bacterium]
MKKAEEVIKKLIEKNYFISCAESCTGGKVTAALVDVPDASKVLGAGVITYSNEAKMKYLQVKKDTLDKYGAVSEETAREMAEGIAKVNQAQVGVSVTGVAGPGGGTPEKPVGMVCFGFSICGKVTTFIKQFGNLGRNQVRDASVRFVLEKLIELLA